MLTPDDVKINKVEYPLMNKVEYHVMVRVFKKVTTGWFSSKIVPTDEFQIGYDYNGYDDFHDYYIYPTYDQAITRMNIILSEYFSQPKYTTITDVTPG